MNTCYKIFHLDSSTMRKSFVKRTDFYLKEYFYPLTTPTIKISNKQEYHKFYDKNKDIIIYPGGYCPNNPSDFNEGWKYGELGIWASHYTAWKNFLKTKFDYLILIEDDIVLNNNFYYLLMNYIKELPQDWDILSLYAPFGVTEYHTIFDIKKKYICKSYQDWSTGCYIVSRLGAKNFIKNATIVRYPLDWFLFRQSFNAYTYKPTPEPPCFLVHTESPFRKKKRIKL